MNQYHEPVCDKCGTPSVPGSAATLVLYFDNPEDADEFVQAIREVMPGLTGYQIGEKPHGT